MRQPTRVQAVAIPRIGRSDSDLIIQARNGTGKTLVFALAGVERMLEEADVHTHTSADGCRNELVAYPEILVVVPTAELAVQHAAVVNALGSALVPPLQTAVLSGATSIDTALQALGTDARAAVGSPGRLAHLLRLGLLSAAAVVTVAVDEADVVCLTSSFRDDMATLAAALPASARRMFFTATLPDGFVSSPHVAPLLRKGSSPEIVAVDAEQLALEHMAQFHADASACRKPRQRKNLLESYLAALDPHQAVVFASSHALAASVANALSDCGWATEMISGKLAFEERNAALERFREYNAQILVATDVLARGISIDRVSVVVNYGLPASLATYLHRIGRSGRAGARAAALTLTFSANDGATLQDWAQAAGAPHFAAWPDPATPPPALVDFVPPLTDSEAAIKAAHTVARTAPVSNPLPLSPPHPSSPLAVGTLLICHGDSDDELDLAEADYSTSFTRLVGELDRYVLEAEVGRGTYGKVYKAQMVRGTTPGSEPAPQTSEIVALKEFNGADRVDGIPLSGIREMALLRELKHPSLVTLHDVVVEPGSGSTFLVLEYVEHDLEKLLIHHAKRKHPLMAETVRSMMWQLVSGIEYMHANWVMHRDMKPSNVLVYGHGPHFGHIKITDFGMARIFKTPAVALTANNPVVATLWYRAPELLLGARHYTPAIDVWALGVIFAELLFLQVLFKGKQIEEKASDIKTFQSHQMEAIVNILGTPDPATWPGLADLAHANQLAAFTRVESRLDATLRKLGKLRKPQLLLSSQACDLLKRMVAYNPDDRITCADALRHPYFAKLPAPTCDAFAADTKPLRYPLPALKPVTSSSAGPSAPSHPPLPPGPPPPPPPPPPSGLPPPSSSARHRPVHPNPRALKRHKPN
ncbi:uncharacterized protein AMSG_12302 [Thecamonas trahens ATCC 50062]|uniref:Cyclin-dependent kinase 8 n=1 Tax=Thecamonas trahens ATCC 50062 TaxID=461836 RepID=A0A0L0DPF0_THETB|nr:hypothetical protein AMSG_12302 [Thecamonas trahens ATCC 50062]KNC54135.1 hypothetical protein AMSG_12302 [Thecamonas trahens ATCC 50062]|eukprot:XP_013754010.1 hypothetical protein AMSG_12302 [Thecamonas trahens ATCC 50062]